MEFKSLQHIQSQLNKKQISLPEIVNHYLSKIETKNKSLNAFLEVFDDEARTSAKTIQKKIDNGTAGRLAGLVIGLKDNIVYKGHKVTACSKMLEHFESLYSATVVDRLLAEDAIIIGRLNCDEFAMGSSNETSYFGKVHNPVNTDFVPGGSSGGAASAVSAGLCLAALGSDTGGSIRQPASYTGIVGMKPSYGRVSRYGLIAYSSSFDQIGTLTKTVEDAALILEVIAGKDEYDSTLSSQPVDAFASAKIPEKPLRIAYIKDTLYHPSVDAEIKDAILKKINLLQEKGHLVEGVDFPYIDYLVPTYYVLTTAEASSNLARYDGIHFGYRSANAHDIESTYVKSRSEGFGTEVKRRIMTGTFVLSAGYYDAYYAKGQKVRRLIKDKTNEIFEQYDLILLPTTPATAFRFGEKSDDPIAMYLEDIFTVHANMVGIPAISIPIATHSNGLPFGMQLMTPRFSENLLLATAEMIQNGL